MIKEEAKFVNSLIFEGMTSIRAILKAYELGINDRKIEAILFDKDKKSKISKELRYFKAVSEKYGFTIVESTAEDIEKITLGNSHGGIVAIAKERTIPSLSSNKILQNGFYTFIQGIEDPYNFGYSIRSLYAMGCDGIILGKRNWMSAAGVVSRSSAGASELIPMYQTESDEEAVAIFKSCGYNIVCADVNTDNLLGDTPFSFPLLLVVGGEKRGISKYVLQMADKVVKISYSREFNASLSAASATTMFAYEIMRQNKK